MGVRIRRYADGDHDAVYDICVRTADAGGDARGQYSTDDLMPDLFAGPYVFLEPRFAFVLDDGGRAVGYVIGTPDTEAFARAYRDRWIPRLADRYQVPPDPPVTRDDEMLALHYKPEHLLWAGLPQYPAHLHIDLLLPVPRTATSFRRRRLPNSGIPRLPSAPITPPSPPLASTLHSCRTFFDFT